MTQSNRASGIEAVTSTAAGFLLALITTAVVFPHYGLHVSHGQNFQITGIFTAVSVVRGYIVRRVFNHMGGGHG